MAVVCGRGQVCLGNLLLVLTTSLSRAPHANLEPWMGPVWHGHGGSQDPMGKGSPADPRTSPARAQGSCRVGGKPCPCPDEAEEAFQAGHRVSSDGAATCAHRYPCSPGVVHPGLRQAAHGPQASWTVLCQQLLPCPLYVPEDGPHPVHPVPMAGAQAWGAGRGLSLIHI